MRLSPTNTTASLSAYFSRFRNEASAARVEYVDLKGNLKEVEVEGFLAKAFQHEIDHLNGKVFIDLLSPWKRKDVEKEIRKRKKGGNW